MVIFFHVEPIFCLYHQYICDYRYITDIYRYFDQSIYLIHLLMIYLISLLITIPQSLVQKTTSLRRRLPLLTDQPDPTLIHKLPRIRTSKLLVYQLPNQTLHCSQTCELVEGDDRLPETTPKDASRSYTWSCKKLQNGFTIVRYC